MSNHDDLPPPPTAEPTIIHTVEIAHDEFLRLFELRLICDDDERKAIGNLRLHTVNGRRCWDATDSIRAARFSPNFDNGEYDLLVPPSMLMFGSAVREGLNPQLQLIAMPDGSRRIVLVGEGGSTSVEHRDLRFPDLDDITSGSDDGVRATLSHIRLLNFTHPLRYSRFPLKDDDPMVPCLLTLEGDGLRADLDWGDCGISTSLIPVRGSGGTVSRLVAPALLNSLTLLVRG